VDLVGAGSIPGVAAPPERLRRTELDSGVVVCSDTVEHARSVAVSVWVGVGGRDEPDALQGVSHFLEHLLFKGTPDATAMEIARAVDQVGGELNAYTTSEHTVFHVRVPATALALALEVLTGVVSEAALRSEDLDNERQVILEELAVALDDPEDVVGVRLFESVFGDHPLGREVLGTPATIEALGRGEVADFRDHWYRPGNLVVAAAGRVDHDALLAHVERAWPATGVVLGERPVRSGPGPTAPSRVEESRPGDVAHLAQAWRTCSAVDDDRTVVAVLNHLLGGGPSSRLFQVVREERALSYSIGSALSLYSDAGVLSLQCSTGVARLDELVDTIGGVVREIVREGVDEAEVDRACRSLWASTAVALEDTGARAGRLGSAELLHGRIAPIAEFRDRLSAVDAERVSAMAVRVLGEEPVTSVVLPE
jgi:predicted Zn-dependent peptidase